MDLIGPSNGLDRCASSTQQQTMGAAPSSECGILLHRFFSEFTLLVGQRLHISHDHHLIRSWGIRHEKRFDVDEVLYQHCVKKLLVWYLCSRSWNAGCAETCLSGVGRSWNETYCCKAARRFLRPPSLPCAPT